VHKKKKEKTVQKDVFATVISFFNKLYSNNWTMRLSLIIAGGIYPLAFSPFEIWPLAFISLFVLLGSFFVQKSLSNFKCGFYWGLGCFGVGASWVYVSIHEFGFVPALGAGALTMLFVSILALYKGLFAYLTGRIIQKTDKLLFVFIAPLVWSLSEFLQASLFNGFPWLLTGYSQIDSPFGAIASWFGVYGVSWLTLAFAAAIVTLIFLPNRRVNLTVAAVLAGLVVTSNIHYRMLPLEKEEPITVDVALVQPNVLQHEKWDRRYFSKIINILYQETEEVWGADLIIWPEGAIPAYAHQVNDITMDLTRKAQQSGSQLVLGIPEYQPETKRSYVALNTYGESSQGYHKQILVPFGEYVPLEEWLRGIIQFLDLPMSGFTEARNQSPMTLKDYTLIPAICYEIAYPEIIRQLAVNKDSNQSLVKPKLIVTVSNEAWFGDSFGPYQHMQMARMRALELGVPLARSTNDGITGFVNARGEVEELLPRYQQSYLRKRISLENYPTIYRKWGMTGLYGIFLVSAITLLIFWLKRRKLND